MKILRSQSGSLREGTTVYMDGVNGRVVTITNPDGFSDSATSTGAPITFVHVSTNRPYFYTERTTEMSWFTTQRQYRANVVGMSNLNG